ncbi:olfactory receptor 5AN6-like [Natator depressus]|uniref:olfactory receptor 5AN6-like n=1 Tax=Natator depressus TaxID=27790 RepID=UPI003EC11F0A
MGIIGLIRLTSHLHTPMYFFLSNFSFLNICYASSIIPGILHSLMSGHRAISYPGCKGQMYVALSCRVNECLLPAVMAYDHYMAVCLPLGYMVVMSRRACISLVACSWMVSLSLSIVPVFSLSVPFCGPNQIDHFFCKMLTVMQLGQRKAFSTCASDLMAVALFHRTAIFIYMWPRSAHSPGQDKMASVFYTVVTPMLNP